MKKIPYLTPEVECLSIDVESGFAATLTAAHENWSLQPESSGNHEGYTEENFQW